MAVFIHPKRFQDESERWKFKRVDRARYGLIPVQFPPKVDRSPTDAEGQGWPINCEDENICSCFGIYCSPSGLTVIGVN